MASPLECILACCVPLGADSAVPCRPGPVGHGKCSPECRQLPLLACQTCSAALSVWSANNDITTVTLSRALFLLCYRTRARARARARARGRTRALARARARARTRVRARARARARAKAHLTLLEVVLHVQCCLFVCKNKSSFVECPRQSPELAMEGVDGRLALPQLSHACCNLYMHMYVCGSHT